MTSATDGMTWVPLLGTFEMTGAELMFRGSPLPFTQLDGQQKIGAMVGVAVTPQIFSGGTMEATVTFAELSEMSAFNLMVYNSVEKGSWIGAGLGAKSLGGIMAWTGEKFDFLRSIGDYTNLRSGQQYHVRVTIRGSALSLSVNEVAVLTAPLSRPLTRGQVGVWCRDSHDIKITGFRVTTERPKAFVVMEFTQPYTDIHHDVIKVVCNDLGLDAIRADDTFSPGIIIADVVRQINSAALVIAEITPRNPNVYYELGYAHAMAKPTILLANRSVEHLPFDVSPYRILFYDDSIGGKAKFEEGLRKHVSAILDGAVNT